LGYSQGQDRNALLSRAMTYASVPYSANTTIPMQAGGGY
jgi:hypothetical protein